MSHHRIFFYSHDTVGLGHIRRTQKLANCLANENRSILIACASPVASSYVTEPGIEYLNLPGFTKLTTGDYVPRNLNVPPQQFISLRSSLLLAAVSNFAPDLVIIDKEPLGVKGELRASLQYLREVRPECRIICGFRDILDENEVTAAEWARKGTIEALRGFFDKIYVYGDEEIFDFSKQYALPADLANKVEYTGYVNPDVNKEPSTQKLSFRDPRPLVTFTLGGGGDGERFIDVILQTLDGGKHGNAFNSLLITGPFVSRELLDRVKALEETRGDLQAIRFTSNTGPLFEQSDIVVSMGGYNTMCELMAMRKYPLIIPRVEPRLEQLIRAKVFQEKGLCEFLDPRELSPEALMNKLRYMFSRNDYTPPAFRTDGLKRVAASVEKLLQ